jgi:hypothetical protein
MIPASLLEYAGPNNVWVRLDSFSYGWTDIYALIWIVSTGDARFPTSAVGATSGTVCVGVGFGRVCSL